MIDESFIELEKAAKALDLSDVHTAAICFRKALEGHIAMRPPEASPEPDAVDPRAELAKAINALEVSDFSLAGLCAEKAAQGLKSRVPAEVDRALMEAARSVRSQELTTAASAVRDFVRQYRPDLTLPPPAQAPTSTVAVTPEPPAAPL